MPELAIDVQNLNLWYGTFQALFHIDFEVKQGRVTALIGPSAVANLPCFVPSTELMIDSVMFARLGRSMSSIKTYSIKTLNWLS